MDELKAYVRKMLDQGVDAKQVKAGLVQAGWPEKEIDRLVGEATTSPSVAASSGFPLAPSTAHIFIGLAALALLVEAAFALGAIWTQIINHYFPDALVSRSTFFRFFAPDGKAVLRAAIAAVIVSFPLYVVLTRLHFAWSRRDSQRLQSRLVKWFTYIVLFFAGSSVVGKLITLITNYLNGELGTRVVLKFFVVVVIASLVLVFYIFERRSFEYKRSGGGIAFMSVAGLASVLVVVGVIWGIIIAGSPWTERLKKFDTQRASHLSALDSAITRYANSNNKLPSNLEELKNKDTDMYSVRVMSTTDPDTEKPYEYKIVSDSVYELCATFAFSNQEEKETGQDIYSIYSLGSSGGKWSRHDKGRVCHEGTVMFRQTNIAPAPAYVPSPQPSASQGKAQDANRKSNAQSMTTAIALYMGVQNPETAPRTNYNCPFSWVVNSQTGIGCPDLSSGTSPLSRYLKVLPSDSVANTYLYTNQGSDRTFCLGVQLSEPNSLFVCNSTGCDEQNGSFRSGGTWSTASCPEA